MYGLVKTMTKRNYSNHPPRSRKQLDFEEWYAIAKQYYDEHGNLLVPRSYEDTEGHKLGRWIERMRAVYNGKEKVSSVLTTTGIEMLNKIGMIWKLEDRFTWQEWLLQCRLYYAANGDLLVPKAYKNDKYALGNWIIEQRKLHKKGKLAKEKVEALEQCGMVWEVVDRDVWEKRYNDARIYYREHGNLDISPALLTAGNISLREWLIAQKSLFREENCKTDLDWERHDLLDDIGIDWEKTCGKTAFSYANRAKRFFEEHGNLNVPENYKDEMGLDLYGWVKRQWYLYHRTAIGKPKSYKTKKKELEKIGFDWSCEGRWDWDPKEAAWLRNYTEIEGYVEENKKLPVGVSSITLSGGTSSECWIDAQRVAIKNGIINEDKQEMLASIGIIYGQKEADWKSNYNFVADYVKKHHHLPVWTKSKIMPSGIQSGSWISGQRNNLKNNALPDDKVKMLADIGIVYGSIESNWYDNYNCIKEYYRKNGELPIGGRSISLPSGGQSTWWIKHQGSALRDKRLTEDKAQLLIDLGIGHQD